MNDFFNDFDPINEYPPVENEIKNNKTENIEEAQPQTSAPQADTPISATPVDTNNDAPVVQSAPVYTYPVQPGYVIPPQGVPYQVQGYPYPVQSYPVPVQMPPQPMPYTQPVNVQYVNPQNTNSTEVKAAEPVVYTNNSNPYTQPPKPEVVKTKTPTRTKVLIGILIGLLAAFATMFVLHNIMDYQNKSDKKDPFDSFNEYFGDYFDEFDFDNFDSFDSGDDYYNYDISSEGETFTEEITLQADEGQTQRNDSAKDNTYKPNKDFKGVETVPAPKDKDSSKYTAQSAYNALTDTVVSVVCYEEKITGKEEDVIGEGTGLIVSSDGYIVTNSHVIGDCKDYVINIILNNAKEYKAKIVGIDTRTDLAVLKIDATKLKYAKFADSSKVNVGQDIIAIGNPGGTSFQNSLTKGIVSAVDRELELDANVKYIQIDAAINPGNSGGPLCNLYGQVIGINTAKIGDSYYEGMGFAIPSNKVMEIANDLIRYGYVKDRVMLGIEGYALGAYDSYYESSDTDTATGIYITAISEGGPLDGTDIQVNDVITEIDGKPVDSFQDVFAILEEHKAGDKIELTILRPAY